MDFCFLIDDLIDITEMVATIKTLRSGKVSWQG